MTITAFRATAFRAEASAYTFVRRVSLLTNEFPALPEGNLKGYVSNGQLPYSNI